MATFVELSDAELDAVTGGGTYCYCGCYPPPHPSNSNANNGLGNGLDDQPPGDPRPNDEPTAVPGQPNTRG